VFVEKVDKDKKLAFILKDETLSIDTLIYVHFDNNMLKIASSQALGDVRYILIPYVLIHYEQETDCDWNPFVIEYVDNNKNVQDFYNKYTENREKETEAPDVERTLNSLIDELAEYYDCDGLEKNEYIGRKKRPISNISDYFVPEFDKMNKKKFGEWLKYFLNGMKDDKEKD